jgi:6-phosphofructokinase 1
MNIGIIHVGTLTAGSHYILQTMIEVSLRNGFQLYGIQWDEELMIHTKLLNENTLSKWKDSREMILASFPKDLSVEHFLTLSQFMNPFHSVIVLGGHSPLFNKGISKTKTKVLEVPISIFNDTDGSDLSLGYDTALNGIVNNILKIQDTLNSLLYSKPRVFCVQIPGKSFNPLLENVSLAVSGHIVTDSNDKNEIKYLIEKINKEYAEGKTFFVLIVNESVNPNEIKNRLLYEMDIDYKWNFIDESQCVGPFPTAVDRILAIQLMGNIVKWIDSNDHSKRLVIEGHKVVMEYPLKTQ